MSLPDTGVSTLISAVLQPACTETVTTSAPCPTYTEQTSEAVCNCAPSQVAAIIFGVSFGVLLLYFITLYMRNRRDYNRNRALTPANLERHQSDIRLRDLAASAPANPAAGNVITPPAPVHLRDSTARNDGASTTTPAGAAQETARNDGLTTVPAAAASAQEDTRGKHKRMSTIHESKEDSAE